MFLCLPPLADSSGHRVPHFYLRSQCGPRIGAVAGLCCCLWTNLLSSDFLIHCDLRNWKPRPKALRTLSKLWITGPSTGESIMGLNATASAMCAFPFPTWWGGLTPPISGMFLCCLMQGAPQPQQSSLCRARWYCSLKLQFKELRSKGIHWFASAHVVTSPIEWLTCVMQS